MTRAWADVPLRAKWLVVVAIPLVALLVATPSTIAIQQVDNDADAWIRHTLLVRGDLQDLTTTLLDAQSSVRGYALTGRQACLGTYQASVAALPRSLDQLAALVQDNPTQRERVGRIAALTRQEIDGLEALREVAASGRATPGASASADAAGTATMGALRRELSAAQAEEDRLLVEREARQERAQTTTYVVDIVSVDMAREHRPDLILLDLHLPDLPGQEVLRRLREEPATRAIPVVVISADATAGQINRLLAAGARAYLTKPIDVAKFLEVVVDALLESGVT